MNNKIADKLNQINKEFYKIQASSFSDTRAISWAGWDGLKKFFKSIKRPDKVLKICDIGCGNGRFVDFLDTLSIKYEYLGVDFSDELMEIARTKYANHSNVRFLSQDLQDDFTFSGKFDFIVCFGVMHHIFDYDRRLEFIKKMMNILLDGGILVISFWQFMNTKRLSKLILDERNIKKYLEEDATKLQKNDYLLDWDKSGRPRYCHHFSDEEIEQIKNGLSTSRFEILGEYNADGKESNLNKYLIYKK